MDRKRTKLTPLVLKAGPPLFDVPPTPAPENANKKFEFGTEIINKSKNDLASTVKQNPGSI